MILSKMLEMILDMISKAYPSLVFSKVIRELRLCSNCTSMMIWSGNCILQTGATQTEPWYI